VNDRDRTAVVLGQRAHSASADVGPLRVAAVATKVECSMRNRPPRTKIAPPPPPSKSSPVELPCVKVRFATVSRGVAWSWQCDVVNR
jgi:hypothetical protein